MQNKPPALSHSPRLTSSIPRDNLNALHYAWEAFIQSEHSEHLWRALKQNVCTYNDATYLPGDRVYYKRVKDRKGKGSASVLSKDGQPVLFKHGVYHVRVYPCRLFPVEKTVHAQPDVNASLLTQDNSLPTTPHNADTSSD